MTATIIIIVILIFTGVTQGLTDTEWQEWKLTHDKEYENQESEDTRRQIWSENYKLIEEHNRGDHSFKLALNHFADLVSK